MIRVLAVDPGQRVGWASATIEPGIAASGRPTYDLDVTAHGIAFLKDAALAIHQAVVVEDRYDVVIYETWLLRAAMAKKLAGDDMQSSQFIGMVRQSCWLNPRVELVPQGPAAMSSATKSANAHPSGADIQARIARLPKSHDESHDGSALLHLWHFFFERYV